ncbi:amidohydrolase family protein [Salicibibacter cibarius]|uniref:Amidohydrolase family protein n=1 Tax=Salicibibacter cibarius TaxID=2743000 RepID=A0A7T7CCH1_9BACI|nr:amidohydrolase family protein [Salicibibacter cibarius]QQK76953.1 amidohydrolase family protein [Salicibibacter cibarius]
MPKDKKKNRGSSFWKFFKRLFLTVAILIVLVIVGGVTYYYATIYNVSEEQEGYLALTNATVLFGEELESYEDSTILIEDDMIVSVGDDIDIPDTATIKDMNGKTVMPGLIDMHVHLGMPELEEGEEFGLLSFPKMIADFVRYTPEKRNNFLEHGVTTIRSVGDEHEWIMEFRDLVNDREIEGPRLYASGSLFTTLEGHPIATVGTDPHSEVVLYPETPGEARENVEQLADDGVDLIKVVQERGPDESHLEPIDEDVLRSIVDEAHTQNIPVFGHWGRIDDLEDLLMAGADGLEHIGAGAVRDGWEDDLLDEITEQGISMTPTLRVETLNGDPEMRPDQLERVKEFHDAGGTILAGTDAGMPGVSFGPSMHEELELLVESGLTPNEALQSATSHASDALQSNEFGIIEEGRAADLVVIDGDPSQRIEDIQNVTEVFRDGRLVVEN